MAEWREEILKGVDTISMTGVVPGVILVYGENAYPIVTNDEGHVLIAAAEVGMGRILVFSHSRFLGDFKSPPRQSVNRRFNKNMGKWLSKGTKIENVHNVAKCCDFDKISDGTLLFWNGNKAKLKDAEVERLFNWLEQGGMLICSSCPWGYEQISGKSIDEMSLAKFVKRIGMCFVGGLMFTRCGGEVCMSENHADCSKIDKSSLCRAKSLKHIADVMSRIPDDVYNLIKNSVLEVVNGLDVNHVPTRSKPIKTPRAKEVSKLINAILIRDGLNGENVIADGIENFPGVFPSEPELKSTSLELSSSCKRNISTGCYLPAGVLMEVSWSQTNDKSWAIRIGLQDDELKYNKKKWTRWSKIRMGCPLVSSPLKICSPFGGLVYLESPKGNAEINLNFENIVPAPVFTYETASKWETEERNKPGIWCDIIGEKVSFTLPSKSIRSVANMEAVLKAWDSVVEANIKLRGRDPSCGRGEWIVADQQLQFGYMHAGYPICTHLDITEPDKGKFLFKLDNFSSGNGLWGLFHELGHQFQNSMWTWNSTKEVTVNIFTLHAMETICKCKIWIHPFLQNKLERAKNYLKKGAARGDNRNAGVSLFVYAQIARDFGWKAYTDVFKFYDDLPKNERPSSAGEKERQWMTRLSKVVKRNLVPVFDFWGWEVPEEILEEVKEFEPYLPEDETTKDLAPNRAGIIAKKYRIETHSAFMLESSDENDDQSTLFEENCGDRLEDQDLGF